MVRMYDFCSGKVGGMVVHAPQQEPGTPGFLQQSKDMQMRLTDSSKLPLNVMLVCLYVSAPWWTGPLSRVYLTAHPMSAGVGFSPLQRCRG